MLIAAHSISGGVMGEAIGNPFLALLFGFVLHFILDAIPHFDTTDDGKMTKRQLVFIAIDGSLGLAVFLWLLFGHSKDITSFLAGAFGSLIPDLLDNVKLWEKKFRSTKFGKNFNAFHERVHQNIQKKYFPLGIVTQALVVVISIFLYLRFVV